MIFFIYNSQFMRNLLNSSTFFVLWNLHAVYYIGNIVCIYSVLLLQIHTFMLLMSLNYCLANSITMLQYYLLRYT